MNRRQTSYLDLPMPLLSHILGLLALENGEDEEQHLANAMLACRTLQQAGEVVQHTVPLWLTSAKLREAGEAKCKGLLLAWVTRKGQLWCKVVVEVESLRDLRLLLGSLAPENGSSSSLRSLELRFLPAQKLPRSLQTLDNPERCYRLPKELERLTGITELSIWQLVDYPADCLLGPDLTRLSSLATLRSLAFDGILAGPLPPPEALTTFQQLTSLTMLMHPVRDAVGNDWEEDWQQSLRPHLLRCTAMRRLLLDSVDPIPSLSEQEALAAWQHLEDLEFVLNNPVDFPTANGDAGIWRALPQLPCLTRLRVSGVEGGPSRALSASLPACLASLQLLDYSEPALPPLPPALTELDLWGAHMLTTLPVSPSLHSLKLEFCGSLTQWPDSFSAMVHLTRLCLTFCRLEQFPAQLAALPALEALDLSNTHLTDLPQELACATCLAG